MAVIVSHFHYFTHCIYSFIRSKKSAYFRYNLAKAREPKVFLFVLSEIIDVPAALSSSPSLPALRKAGLMKWILAHRLFLVPWSAIQLHLLVVVV